MQNQRGVVPTVVHILVVHLVPDNVVELAILCVAIPVITVLSNCGPGGK